MAEFTVRALVLRRYDTGDSDRRLVLLTHERGKLDAVAKGARKAASRLAGVSDPLCLGTLTLAEGKARRFVVGAQPERAFRGLRTDYDRLQQALALCEMAEAILPWEEPVPEAAGLLERGLAALESHPRPVAAYAWTQVRLLEWAGFWPQFDACIDTDAPIEVANPWVSVRAGGALSEGAAESYSDRFRVRAEVLYGLARLAGLDEPPPNLRFAAETCLCLMPFWRSVADKPLGATEAAAAELAKTIVQE